MGLGWGSACKPNVNRSDSQQKALSDQDEEYSDRAHSLAIELDIKVWPFYPFDLTATCLHCTLTNLTDGDEPMIDKLSEGFSFRQEALNLRQERQKVLAANIANADTPQYKARDFDFSKELAQAMESGRSKGGLNLTTTSEGHLPGKAKGSSGVRDLLYRVPEQPSLDGNTVDMERERAQFADNSVRVQASLTLMNSYIQGLKGAMRPE